jgi:hypothetical protein
MSLLVSALLPVPISNIAGSAAINLRRIVMRFLLWT